MAITYENVVFNRVLDSLHSIVADEYSIPIYFDEHMSNQSFLIEVISDDIEESLTSGQIRVYEVEIAYQLESPGNYTKNKTKQVSEIMERLKRLLYNNRNYAVNGVTKFYNGIVNGITYERDDDNEELLRGILSFTCTTMELV